MALFDFLKKKMGDKNQPHLSALKKYELPSFPSAVMNLLAKLRDPESTVQELADEIEIDPGLHVRILKTVNSVAFGLTRKVDTVRHAVTLLGRSRLEALVLSVAVQKTVGHAAAGINLTEFWHTAALRAALARRLASRMDPGKEAESFAAGLLQDMGVPVLAGAITGYADIYNKWLSTENADLSAMEMDTYNTDHASVGALMAEQWALPPYLAQAITHHHTPQQSDLVFDAVQIASLLKTEPDDDEAQALAEHVHGTFGIEPDYFLTSLEASKAEAKELAEALS